MYPSRDDPVERLGSALFLHILNYLPYDSILQAERVSKSWKNVIGTYEKSIWKKAAFNLNADNPDLHLLELVAHKQSLALRQPSSSSAVSTGDAGVSAPPAVGSSTTRWRKECRDAVELDRNWRLGRCREHWITTPENSVWRFKIDHAQGTCLSTSRLHGLHVVDTETSERLFSIEGVRTHAHLEFAAGHAIFDIGTADFALEVYRTSEAIAASRHASPKKQSPLSRTSKSYTRPGWVPGSDGPLPRGHLEYYKTISPPTRCQAFRARVDRAGTKDERALLATAGFEAVYIWDMEEEDPLKRETIRLTPEQEGEISYVEFDDDYVFICQLMTTMIFSRKTKQLIYEIPVLEKLCRVHSRFDFWHDSRQPYNCQAPIIASSSTSTSQRPPQRQCIEKIGSVSYNEDPDFGRNMIDSLHNLFEDLAIPEEDFPFVEYEWNACHYTRDDLHISSLAGVVLTIRDYRRLLAIEDPEERSRQLNAHTIWTTVEFGNHLLSTTASRLACVASDQVIFWNPSDFPSLHLDDSPPPKAERPNARCHLAQIVGFIGVNEASCLQVDHNRIYVTYTASADQRHEGDDVPSDYPTLDAGGWAIKAWDFSP